MRPGVMIYFDIATALEMLTDAERGQFFSAILRYGMYGELPAFTGATALAWAFIQPRLDADAEKYDDTVLQKKYAAYCRESKRAGKEPMIFANWREQLISDDIDRCVSITNDNGRHPTTTTTTTTDIAQNNIIVGKPSQKQFSPPSIEEVAEYCAERNNGIDAQRFVDYYSSIGWKVGKNSMKDWRAAVRTWEGKNKYGTNKNDKYSRNDNTSESIAGITRL